MPTVQEMVAEFHKVFGLQINEPLTEELLLKRGRLHIEEEGELYDEWHAPLVFNRPHDLAKITKELADMVYVLYGHAVSLGINLDRAVELVHASNMSKLDNEGKPIIDSYGKALKGPNYQAPNLTECLP